LHPGHVVTPAAPSSGTPVSSPPADERTISVLVVDLVPAGDGPVARGDAEDVVARPRREIRLLGGTL